MGFFLQRLNEVLYDKAPSAMSDNKVGAQYMCQFPPQGSHMLSTTGAQHC